MKMIKSTMCSFMVVAVSVATMVSCTDYKDEIDDLDSRVTALETWQKSVNSSIKSLQDIVSALENKDYVTSVTQTADGYTINFEKKGPITIKNGENGTTPIIGAKQDKDGKYYWTVNEEWLLVNGVKIPTSGIDGQTAYIGENGNWWIGTTDTGIKAQGEDGANAIAPKVRINKTSGEWEVSIDGGKNWTSTGVKAQGDSIFKNIDTSNDNYVSVVLADGYTVLRLPKYQKYRIVFWDSDHDGDYDTAPIELTSFEPADFTMRVGKTNNAWVTNAEYGAVKATIESKSTIISDVNGQTRAVDMNHWQVKVEEGDILDNGNIYATVISITPPAGIESEEAILTVTFYDKNGTSASVSRIVRYSTPVVNLTTAGTLAAALANRQIDYATIKALRIKGSMDKRDFNFIKANMPKLLNLDLTEVNIHAVNIDGISYIANEIPPLAIGSFDEQLICDPRTIILPRSATSIGKGAFALCSNLWNLVFPEGTRMKRLGRWILQYSGLTNITIPSSITELSMSTFFGCLNLESVKFEAGCKINEIPNWCFQQCPLIKAISLPESVTTIGDGAFSLITDQYIISLDKLESFEAPNVTSIGEAAFWNRSHFKTMRYDKKIVTIGADAFTYNDSNNSRDHSNCALFINSTETISGNIWNGYTWKSIDFCY